MPFAVLQLVAFRPPAELGAVPFSRLWVGVAVVTVLVGTNLVSRHIARSEDVARVRRFGMVELVVDTTVAATVMVLFGFDPTSRLWPILTFPIIEGAMRGGLTGAMATWGYGGGIYVVEQLLRLPGRDDPGAWIGSIPWGVGILLFVALGTGTLADHLVTADERVQREKERLRRLSELGRQMNAERSPRAVHQRIAEAGVTLLGLPYASLYEHLGDATWRRLASVAVEGPSAGIVEHIPVFTELAGGLEGPTGMPITGDLRARANLTAPDAQFVIVSPIRTDGQLRGLLFLATPEAGTELADDTYDMLELLTGHAATAMRNADLSAAEERTIAELRELDRMKDDFLSILTHELRSPMTAMAGSAELLRDRWGDIGPERREEFLTSIQRNTTRLAALIQDVFDALKAERTDLPVTLEPTDLLPLLVEAAEQEVSASGRHELRFDVDTAVPPALADPDRVSQILHNLLNNAVKYSPQGGTITVGLSRRDDEVAVRVTDEGLGIPEAQQQRLFGKFQRLHAAERGIRGTGLGLYLAKTLAEAMDGRIAVESRESKGSTFTVWLPVASPSRRSRSA